MRPPLHARLGQVELGFIAVAQLAKTAIEPALLTIGRNQARIDPGLHGVEAEEVGAGPSFTGQRLARKARYEHQGTRGA